MVNRPTAELMAGQNDWLSTSSDPAGYTSDNFRDVRRLELHPEFRDYMRNAFAPGGDYLSFWQPSVEATSLQSMHVMLVNDEYREVENTLTLALENSKSERIVNQTRKFKLAPLGQNTIYNDFKFPGTTGDFLLRAIIEYKANGGDVSTQSRRYARCGDWKGKLIRIICNPVIRYFPKSARLTKSFRTC